MEEFLTKFFYDITLILISVLLSTYIDYIRR